MLGRRGRVTGRIGPGLVGEVMVAVRGGVEAFYAHPAEPGQTIEPGQQVLVIDYEPPRTVYVQPWSGLG